MKKQSHYSDEGLVLTKNQLKDTHQRVTVLSKTHGKLSLTAYGTKSLKSKRLSHLETGNVIRFSWRETDEYASLSETELRYAHSAIKEDADKLDMLYLAFFIANRLLPEKQPEPKVYARLLQYLRHLHSKGAEMGDLEVFLVDILQDLGFIDEKQLHEGFDPFQFVEGLIGRKIRV